MIKIFFKKYPKNLFQVQKNKFTSFSDTSSISILQEVEAKIFQCIKQQKNMQFTNIETQLIDKIFQNSMKSTVQKRLSSLFKLNFQLVLISKMRKLFRQKLLTTVQQFLTNIWSRDQIEINQYYINKIIQYDHFEKSFICYLFSFQRLFCILMWLRYFISSYLGRLRASKLNQNKCCLSLWSIFIFINATSSSIFSLSFVFSFKSSYKFFNQLSILISYSCNTLSSCIVLVQSRTFFVILGNRNSFLSINLNSLTYFILIIINLFIEIQQFIYKSKWYFYLNQQSVINQNFYQDLDDLDDDDSIVQENPFQQQIEQIKQDFSPKSSISTLIQDKEFIEHNKLIKHNIENKIKDNIVIDKYNKDYQIILKSINYSTLIGNSIIIEKEIDMLYRFIRDTFTLRFPELEQLVPSVMDYVQCAILIGDNHDISKVDFSQILNQHQIVSINVASSASIGKLLSQSDSQKCQETCQTVLQLNEYKNLNIEYVQSKMTKIAPNLSNLVGSMIAAQLMAASGGLDALARMPACNIQVIGGQKKTMMGLTKIDKKTSRFGLFGQMDMVKNAPPEFQIKLVRMLSTKSAMAARVDQSQLNKGGELGLRFKQELLIRFDKIQEPGPAKKIKPLVILDERPKQRRGGKKNMKERLAQSEFQKYTNRLSFGEQEQEFRSTGEGFGMIGQAGKLKIQKKEKKMRLTKKQQMAQMPYKNKAIPTDGATTSIAFNPASAMQLVNPAFSRQSNSQANDSFFNKSSGFKTVIQEKNKSLLPF